jgi:hypothetical protein
MRLGWLSCALLLGSGVFAAAQEPTRQEEDSVQAVRAEHDALLNARFEDQRKNPPAAGVNPVIALTEDEAVGFIERCWKIYDRSAGEPQEFEALSAVLGLSVEVRSARLEKEWREAIAHLREQFSDDPRMAELVLRLPVPRKLDKEGEEFIAAVEKSTKSAAVKAAFTFKALQDELNRYSQDQLDDAQLKALATKLQDLAAKFGPESVPFRKTTYAEFARKTIYAMEHLKIGAVAPDIAANDLDGVGFKLSDYRGKVVMLDFWGYW